MENLFFAFFSLARQWIFFSCNIDLSAKSNEQWSGSAEIFFTLSLLTASLLAWGLAVILSPLFRTAQSLCAAATVYFRSYAAACIDSAEGEIDFSVAVGGILGKTKEPSLSLVAACAAMLTLSQSHDSTLILMCANWSSGLSRALKRKGRVSYKAKLLIINHFLLMYGRNTICNLSALLNNICMLTTEHFQEEAEQPISACQRLIGCLVEANWAKSFQFCFFRFDRII